MDKSGNPNCGTARQMSAKWKEKGSMKEAVPMKASDNYPAESMLVC